MEKEERGKTHKEIAQILLQNIEHDFQMIDEYIQSVLIHFFHKMNEILHLINLSLKNVDYFFDNCTDKTEEIMSIKRQTRVKYKILDQLEKLVQLVKNLIVNSIQIMKIEVQISEELLLNKLPLSLSSLAELPIFENTSTSKNFIQAYIFDCASVIEKKISESLMNLHENLERLTKEIDFKQEKLLLIIDERNLFGCSESNEKRLFYVKMELFNDKNDFLRNVQLISLNLSSYKSLISGHYLETLKPKITSEEEFPTVSPPPPEDLNSNPSKKDPLNFVVGMDIYYQSLTETQEVQLFPAVLLSFDLTSQECRVRLKHSGKEKDTIFDRVRLSC